VTSLENRGAANVAARKSMKNSLYLRCHDAMRRRMHRMKQAEMERLLGDHGFDLAGIEYADASAGDRNNAVGSEVVK
jgi:hypothetical protein